MLGKRKWDAVVVRRRHLDDYPISQSANTVVDDNDGDSDDDAGHDREDSPNANELFRKYFESTFDPLPEATKDNPLFRNDTDEDEDEEGDEDETDADTEDDDQEEANIKGTRGDEGDGDGFEGFSDAASPVVPVVEVIEATPSKTTQESDAIDKIFKKTFMTSRPPRNDHDLDDLLTKPGKGKVADRTKGGNGKDEDGDEDDASNLKHDLDLQRLLRESHLLSQSSMLDKATTLHGKQRHQATDLRLLDLGSRSSVFSQDKMPMSHRKGIHSKAAGAEDRRRREARENGIILERSKGKKSDKASSATATRRDRGVDVPVLGRFRGGTLSLSKKDIAAIQGPSSRGGKGRKRGRR